jgi:hypothetical protein
VEDPHVIVTVSEELGVTECNTGGFGSTGTKDILNKDVSSASPSCILPI